jgi:hypothetical protein
VELFQCVLSGTKEKKKNEWPWDSHPVLCGGGGFNSTNAPVYGGLCCRVCVWM